MRIQISKNTLISQFVGIIFVVYALSDILQSDVIGIICTILSIMALTFSFPMKEKPYFRESFLFILVLIFSSVINIFFTNHGLGGSFILLGNLVFSYVYFITDKKKITKWIVLVYFINLLFLIYKLFILKLPANEIYQGLSRNHAGFVLTFWTIFLIFHIKITYSKIFVFFPVISLIMSFFLIGRTSIAVSFVLLLMVLFFKYKRKGPLPFFILIVLFTGIFYYLWIKVGAIILMSTNLNEGLDTPRWKIWSDYIKNINLLTLITGVDVTKVPLIHLFGDNPHNSFLKFHSRVGFGSIIFLILYILSTIIYLIQKNFLILGLLILLSLRALFDSDILIGNFDFIFFIIMFYWIVINKKYHEPRVFINNGFLQ